MKRTLLGGSLALSCLLAQAEWVQVATDQASGGTVLVDPSSVQERDGLLLAWHLFNSKVKVGGVASMKMLGAYNCKTKEMQGRFATTYSESNGRGQVIEKQTTAQPIEPIIPGTLGEKLLNYTCANTPQVRERWEDLKGGSDSDGWKIEKGSKVRQGDLAYLTQLNNIFIGLTEEHISVKTRTRFHCVERWVQAMEVTTYTRLNGTGREEKGTTTPGPRSAPIAADSAANILINFACDAPRAPE